METIASTESTQRTAPTFLGVLDANGEDIHTGDKVGFLSKRHFKSKHGTVYKVSKKIKTIISMDNEGRNISRAPENIRVAGQSGAHVDYFFSLARLFESNYKYIVTSLNNRFTYESCK